MKSVASPFLLKSFIGEQLILSLNFIFIYFIETVSALEVSTESFESYVCILCLILFF